MAELADHEVFATIVVQIPDLHIDRSFEPGDEREVTLVALAGSREVYGFNALTEGAV